MKPLQSNQPRISWRLFLSLSLVLLAFHLYGQCPSDDVIQDPVDFVWTYHPVTTNNPEAYYSGTMEVGEVTLTLNNNETLTTRAYRQKGGSYSVPGPTLKMTPGNKYVLRLENTLPYEAPSPDHNVFKDPNIVNIHTHGLHISGESPGDDVTRFFEGGRGGDFVYDIPADHMGGTFWYHAHHHGSTLLQVAGGMFGMILIDDGNDGMPANVANMKEKILAMGFLDPGVAGTGGDQLISGTLSPSWTVNGIIDGNICIPDNTWEHWRILVADRAAKLRDVEFGPGLEVMVLARDGVWRTSAPKALAPQNNIIQLTGASRGDFAVRKTGTGASWIKVGGVIVANIHTSNEPTDLTVHPFDTDGVSPWSANRPDYLRDLTGVNNVNNESVKLGARTVSGTNHSGKFDKNNPNFILQTTDVQEWSLSGNVQHPFHLHVYHVQAMANDRDFEAGEYYDVVASQMDVRFDLNAASSTPYEGRTIMHCHILAHEDQGAMGWLDVQGGTPPPTFPQDGDISFPYSDYYVIPSDPPAAPSGLTANAISSSSIDIAWVDNASDEDGFNIERSLDGTNFTLITSVGANVTAYNDSGLNASTTYYYRVEAYNGGGSSAVSNVADATTDPLPNPPAAPSGLSATAISSSEIDLVWTDNSNDEDGFNIERSLDGINFSALTSVGVNTTSYADNGLNASTTYYYRVTAYNDGGNSAVSNVANATTDEPSNVTVHVENIVVGREPANGNNRWQGTAVVTIFDDQQAPVSGATVDVSYTGPNSGTRSGTTNNSGEVSFTTNAIKNPNGEWCFTVTNVTHTGSTYDPNANVVTTACESGPQPISGNNGSFDQEDETVGEDLEKQKNIESGSIDPQDEGAKFLNVFPNPAQSEAQLLFHLPKADHTRIELYSLVGDLIGIVVDSEFDAGNHLLRMNTEKMHGGSYILVFKVGNKIESKRLTIIR